MKIKIALIDDHVVVRSGFAQLLTLEDDIIIVGQYSSANEAWPDLLRKTIDIVIMDISMPNESGLQLLARLRPTCPNFRTIMLSIYDTAALVQSALDSGARGYLTKCCGPEELIQAVRTVHKGEIYLCADALKALRQKPQEVVALQALTPREREIFSLLINGNSVKAIAEQLELSHNTVHVHRTRILDKLHCNTTIDLVHYAFQNQIITS
ncbi:response regulator transcription factor [Xenorhabdus doucetiae]|uniref:LuxR family two component transcriptional regulator n=1 Tax=Xenorhabdus doucetiae TaxID=351671 RepID=A0A068QUZ1_9GAMM|nr:response regulator transcription factor [Xenorhabdus doucetiae]TYO96704.1 LuxR family two component transcriptional regulator [Xenorhabdus doucetiae]CDG18768.1 Transcriptional regulatory protein uhpA [Xenorhabdus doucetiae]